MSQGPGEVGGSGRAHDRIPAMVNSVGHSQRNFHRSAAAVFQLSPFFFVVGLDGGLILGDTELEADVSIGVRVCDVMDELQHGPTIGAIRSCELLRREAFYRGTQ